MNQLRPTAIAHDHFAEAQDRYRWLLLTGWFALISTVLPLVIASPPRIEPLNAVPIAVATLALAAYNVALKRYWPIGVALLIAVIAVLAWITMR